MDNDVHSPIQRGFIWAHVGWILARKHNVVHWDRIKDLSKYPELRFLQRFELAIGRDVGIVVLFRRRSARLQRRARPSLRVLRGSRVLLWHGTFTINSFTHLWGRRRYKTTDDSRNSLLFALLTLGELPNKRELDEWTSNITYHTIVHENIKKFMDGFRS